MLTQLIYRSRSTSPITPEDLQYFQSCFEENNRHNSVSGIICFDGKYFLQILEGNLKTLDILMTHIASDSRHKNIVIIYKEQVDFARFLPFGMQLYDVSDNADQLNLIGQLMMAYGDLRIPEILKAFVQGLWSDGNHEAPPLPLFTSNDTYKLSAHDLTDLDQHAACFAFQPILDIKSRTVAGYEALIRGRNGQSAYQLMHSMYGDELHRFDLDSKAWALQTASKLGMTCTVALNLLPQSLTYTSGIASRLLDQIALYGFKNSQILIEITEEELIGDLPMFMQVAGELRAAGVRFAIDDFGAGYAGLSLIADFQPDKLKIDRTIVAGIHKNGPRQAIVYSVLDLCKRLGIVVVAEGVETMEELEWLNSAGIHRIQGFLFAKPLIQGMPSIDWQYNI